MLRNISYVQTKMGKEDATKSSSTHNNHVFTQYIIWIETVNHGARYNLFMTKAIFYLVSMKGHCRFYINRPWEVVILYNAGLTERRKISNAGNESRPC